MGYYEGNISDLGCNGNNGYGNNGWNDWSWIIGLAVVGGIFGNGGFGFGGGNRGNCATQADLSAGFANSEIMSDLNSILLSQAQGFAGLNTAISNATSTLGFNMAEGFHGVDNAVCTLGYQTQSGFNSLSAQLAECCCAQARNIDSLRFDMSKGFCDIIRAGQDNTNAIIGWLTQEKIASLQAENSGLKAQISNDRQTTNIVNELRNGNCPVPAYLACDPRVPFNYGQYFNNSGCGCGCN